MKNLQSIIALCALLIVALACGNAEKSNSNQVSVVSTAPQSAASPTVNPKDVVSAIKWNDIDKIYNLKSNTTDMQKEAQWKNFEGKKVAWNGTVSEVSKGIMGGLTLQIKMNPDTLTSDIHLSLKKDQEAKAMNLSKGEKVSFTGTLNNYGGALLPMTLDDGEVK